MYQTLEKQKPRRLKGRQNPFFFSGERIEVSPLQVELAICIRQYRRVHNITQDQMARICSIRGREAGIKFATSEIWTYENYRIAPTQPKFQVLMDVMGITPEILM